MSGHMCISVPLSWKTLASPGARLDGAQIPFGIVLGVLLGSVAAEASFVAERNCIASQFLADIRLGMPLPVLPALS
jgi:hypothetical protein